MSWSLDRGRDVGWIAQDLEPARLMADAEAQTHLHEWGDDFRRDALNQLLRAAREEARLTVLGQFALARAVKGALCNWLRLIHARRAHSSILEGALQRPILIAGMPRTGTTFLQHLLAKHPDTRHLPMWLAAQPLPCPTASEWRSGGHALRRATTACNAALIHTVMPALRHIHPFGVDLPVECTHLMASSFFSNQWAAWPLYGYLEWLETQEMPSYQPYRDQLLLLQHAIPGQGWVLKSPGHFIAMERVYDQIPEALIVHLHRDPAKVMPSLNSMMACHHLVFTAQPDFQRAADSFLRTFVNAADRVVALRSRADPERFIDVSYPQLRDAPLAVAEQIFRRAGLRWDAEVRQALEQQQHRSSAPRVRHRYPQEQFGQSPHNLHAAFGRYMSTFDVVAEKKG